MDRDVQRTCYGFDGCRGGWFWIGLEPTGAAQCGVAGELAELVDQARETDRVFVDIPIGLQDEDRACDRAARKLLGKPRVSSVFRAPVRGALDHSRYAEASRRNLAATGKKLTKQTFAIFATDPGG